jgi:hypothetical protein
VRSEGFSRGTGSCASHQETRSPAATYYSGPIFVNEENGGAGDRAYGAMIGDTLKNHVATIVDDRGAEQPNGFGFGARDQDKKTPRLSSIW